MNKSKIIIDDCSDIEDFEVVISSSELNLTPYENNLNNIWDEVLEESKNSGVEVWDGLYYRLENIAELKSGSMQLRLSTVRYSTVRSLMKLSRTHDLDDKYFPYHINTGALISTKDDFFVFGEKANSNDDKFIDLIGGGLQKDELAVHTAIDIRDNILKEAFEEANITQEFVELINLNSIVLTNTMSIFIIFNIKLNINREQLAIEFDNRTDEELSGLRFFDKNEVNQFSSNNNVYPYLTIVPDLIAKFPAN
ncbi:NUDIX hydrolase [Pseudoalteromonas sp. SR41-4]|uniref:NUDIX hydrolase n=1 Tax=Pseudoalteromonas sp. SR41-4 TaxID=2760950 RepID=UPI001600F914|nr:NUDIX hydrolase [Pseudoalteromonas sp. SR41-4]MBB1294617.1 NUDIX hydrolase [Pseudoalteromonas sp. SR41-4]